MERVGWLLRVFAVGCLLAAGPVVGDGAAGRAHASRDSTVVRPPGPYKLPAGAVWVHNSRQLVRALARTHATNIVLAAGVYNHHEPFYVRNGSRLYAAHVGQAVLRAGIALGANSGGSGPLLRGLRFDVRDPRRTLERRTTPRLPSQKHASAVPCEEPRVGLATRETAMSSSR